MQTLYSSLEQLINFFRHHQLMEGVIILSGGILGAILLRQSSLRALNFLIRKYQWGFGERLIVLITRPIWITVILVALHKALPLLIDMRSETGFVLEALVDSSLVLMWAVAFSRVLRIVTRKEFATKSYSHEAIQFLGNLGIALVVVNAGFMLLTVWNVDITPLLASAGIVGLAVALAAKDTLANFFGGVNLFIDRPFKKGDYIVLGTGERGAIVEIGLRSTRLITRDDMMICIPNSVIANSKIVNESAPEPHHRVRIKVGVAYGSNLDEVEKALLDIAINEKMVASDPEPRVRFRSFGDSALEFELLCWARRAGDRGFMQHKLNKAIYNLFNTKGIVFPFPQRDVHIKNSN